MKIFKTRLHSVLFTFLFFITGCTTSSSGSGSTNTFAQTLTDIWTNNLFPIFNLSFLLATPETAIMAFMRLMIIILVFSLIFEASRLIRLPRNTGIVLAGVIAIISGVFIPGTILVAIGSSYGFFVALILLATPIVGSFYLFYLMPTAPVIWRWARVILLCVVLFLLVNMKIHALALLAGP